MAILSVACVVDQEDGDAGSSSYVTDGAPAGQTFVPSLNNLTAFDISFQPFTLETTPARYTFQIKKWPDGPVLKEFFVWLAEGDFRCSELHPDGGATCHIELPDGPISLKPGDKYAILVVDRFPEVIPIFGYAFWAGTDAYPAGCAVGNGAESCALPDVHFRTYGIQLFPPPP